MTVSLIEHETGETARCFRILRRVRVLARGPWDTTAVDVRWRADAYEPDPAVARSADEALRRLADRGSPSHDSMAARLARADAEDGRLALELQPVRWSLRLVEGAAARSLFVHCLVRDAEGRWLAGRRSPWLAVLPSAWHLGAAGSVAAGHDPVATMREELEEEWALRGGRLTIVAVLSEPSQQTVLLGVADMPRDTRPRPNDEHDAWAWWPPHPSGWPEEAPADMREVADLAAALVPRPA
jgi:8-oxo-dGTP diphosphatase